MERCHGTAVNGDVELAWVLDGPGTGPVVALLAGSDATAERWSPGFVAALVERGRGVVRFDHRDTGRSSRVPATAPYGLEALVDDVITVLDAVGSASVDVLGHSMGGMVAQLLAVDHPDRVRSLTLVGSSPGPLDPSLSPPTDGYRTASEMLMWEPPPRTVGAKIARHVALAELVAGRAHPGSDDERRAVADREVHRGWEPETGHGRAIGATAAWRDRLGTVSARAVVVHGTDDPVFGTDHAVDLAESLPRADLVLVDGLGHDLPGSVEATLLAALDQVW